MSDQQQDQQQQQQNQSEQSQPESSGVDASGGSDGGAGHEKAEVAAEQQQQHGHNPEQGDEDKAHAASSGDGSEGTSESKNDFVKVEAKDIQECGSEFAGADSKQELEQEQHQQKEANEDGDCSVDVEQTSELIERSGDNTNTSDTNAEKQPIDKKSSIGHSMLPITETQEVSSTKNDDPPRSMRTSRRSSYQSSRGYAGGYQNYGLAYLPYKSNFEPSEDARRKADEFFKTLKL